MQIKRVKQKQLCPHKLAKLEKKRQKARNSSEPHHTPFQHRFNHSEKEMIRQLQTQNQQLKAQNHIFQEYFATFDTKYKEQKRINQRLQEKIDTLSRERERQAGSLQPKAESTCILSERTIGQKTSRGIKESRKTLHSEYF